MLMPMVYRKQSRAREGAVNWHRLACLTRNRSLPVAALFAQRRIRYMNHAPPTMTAENMPNTCKP